MHIYVGNLTTLGSDNGLSPGRRQAIIWTNAGILLIGPLWTNFSEILIEIPTFSFKKMHLKVSSAKWPPFCLGLNVITHYVQVTLHDVTDFKKSSVQEWLAAYADAKIFPVLSVKPSWTHWMKSYGCTKLTYTIKPPIEDTSYLTTYMFLVSSCSCLCSIRWSHVLSRELRFSWSSTDRQCFNYIWVINFIGY